MFCYTRNYDITIPGPVIRTQTEEIYKKIYRHEADPVFKLFSGWLRRWKQWLDSVDIVAAGEYISKFHQCMKQKIAEGMICNVEEMDLYCRILPSRSLGVKKTRPAKQLQTV